MAYTGRITGSCISTGSRLARGLESWATPGGVGLVNAPTGSLVFNFPVLANLLNYLSAEISSGCSHE